MYVAQIYCNRLAAAAKRADVAALLLQPSELRDFTSEPHHPIELSLIAWLTGKVEFNIDNKLPSTYMHVYGCWVVNKCN